MKPRGLALVLVLWLLALLLGVVAAFALNSRIEALQGRSARSLAQARLAAQAGVELAAQRMADGIVERRLVPDGRPYRVQFDAALVTVQVQDITGRLNLNTAAPDTLALLFEYFEIEQEVALSLADAVADWRDPDDLVSLRGAEAPEYAAAGLRYGPANGPFTSVEELQRVLGIGQALYRQVAPFLTVHGPGRVNATFAQAPVLFALGLESEPVLAEPFGGQSDADGLEAGAPEPRPGSPSLAADQDAVTPAGSGTYSIASLAELADGTRLLLNPTVSLVGGGSIRPYAVLAWREGEVD